MINLDKIKHVYICREFVDMRKAVDGLAIIVAATFKLDVFEQSLFIFCNKARNKIKILHFDDGFWLYYRRQEEGKFQWPTEIETTKCITFDELKWLINGHALRVNPRKFKSIEHMDFY